MNRLIHLFASLHLTVWLLLASVLLVFFGTLDQVELGVRGAQIKYFESLITTWGYPSSWPLGEWLQVVHLPIPGAYLLGPLLVLNLCCAHFKHFRPRWSKGGIAMIHCGVLLLILSQLFTQLFQKEYYIWFDEGETVQHLTSFYNDELVIIDVTETYADTVYSFPTELLKVGSSQTAPGLPFTVETVAFYTNAVIFNRTSRQTNRPVANQGVAVTQGLSAHPIPPTYRPNEQNASTAYVRLKAGTETLGTWLVSTLFEDAIPEQTLRYHNRTYSIMLRPARNPLPYTLTLLDFAHDRYPGTNIPKNFSSHVRIRDASTGESREVKIRMNHPLRYAGYTFYQSAFRKDAMGREDRSSRLQVVRNRGWLAPYIACMFISIGLFWQFGWGILKFSNRRNQRAAGRTSKSVVPRQANLPKSRCISSYIILTLLVAGTLVILTQPFFESKAKALDKACEIAAFGKLPVLDGGRLKPFDSLARNFLILARGKQTALDQQGQRVTAIEFFAQLLFDSEAAARYKVFRLDNPQLLDLVNQPNTKTVHLTYNDLKPYLRTISEQTQIAPEEASERSPYHTALLRLYRSIQRYQALEYGFLPPTSGSYSALLQTLVTPSPNTTTRSPTVAAQLHQQMSSPGLLIIPISSETDTGSKTLKWVSPAVAMLDAHIDNKTYPVLNAYFKLADAWKADHAQTFEQALRELKRLQNNRAPKSYIRTQIEFIFNYIQPFYLGLQLYLIAFIATAFFWLLGHSYFARAGVITILIALSIHSIGLVIRTYLSGYAPVTNLYSSSVFIGWVAVLLSLPFERLFRNGLAVAAASLTGFTTLIIAHNIAVAGGSDTMEMMRAVLDSNFWLSTHVTTITIGYATTFLAGILGIFYVFLHFKTKDPLLETVGSLKSMVYGLICFALLFSFVGTILGGIWADQSWGRFWGWDPKENGALMIVLWNALILHGLRTTLLGTRGLMLLAIAGNIITSWSWFGTNMLGVGLHSYGFMNKAFLWLTIFWISQIILIAAGWIVSKREKTKL